MHFFLRGYKLFVFIYLAFLFTVGAKGQLIVDFSTDVTKGCVPLPDVKFRDLSTSPRPIVSRHWTFGNGNSSNSNEPNPKASYPNAGTYTVTLTVSDGLETKTVTKTALIRVFRNPVADFSSGSVLTGCVPLTVAFNDESQEGDGRINKWLWNFGDGKTSTAKNPQNTYILQSDFPVSLTVTDTNNCSASKQISAFVKTSDKPKVSFTRSLSPGCSVPHAVTFTNSSTGNGSLVYSWAFGDGGTSSAVSPAHTYTAFGNYSVTLTATDGYGCSRSRVEPNYIQLSPLVADFTLPDDTFCINQGFTATNTSILPSGATFKWDFGDGVTSTQQNGVHSYSTPGTRMITLYAYNGASCVDSVKKQVTAIKVEARFSTNARYMCKLGEIIRYTGLSVNADSIKWLLGDTVTSREILLGNDRTPDIWIRYKAPGLYTDTLIAYNRLGCNDTLVVKDNIMVSLMSATIEADRKGGCAPVTFRFEDKSVPKDTIVSRLWRFEDGTTTTIPDPTYTLSQVKEEVVTLIVYNAQGCSDSVKTIIKAGAKPQANFIYSDTLACASKYIRYTSTSTPADSIDDHQWSFNQVGPDVYQQFFDTGYVYVQLKVGHNGCEDSIKKRTVRLKGPIAFLNYVPSCPVPWNSCTFTGYRYYGATKLYWNFGDSSGIVTDFALPSVQTHLYNVAKDYYVSVTTDTVDGCFFTYAYPNAVRPRNVKAAFIVDSFTKCYGQPFTFTSTSQDAASFTWHMGDNNVEGNSGFEYTYSSKGTYTVKLITVADNTCRDSVTHTVKVLRPRAAYSISDTAVCVGKLINFTDRSQLVSDTTITWRRWYFGDGVFSNNPNPGHIYASSGNYPVMLIVEDTLGCRDTLLKYDQVTVAAKPSAFFDIMGDGKLCVGESEQFVNLPLGQTGLTYQWDFGDGSSSGVSLPSHVYNQPGKFDVSLKVTRLGCEVDTLLKELIEVQAYPRAGFITANHELAGKPVTFPSYDSLVVNCYPFTLDFTDTASNVVFSKWTWGIPGSLGAGDTISAQYIKPGYYDVVLIDSTSFGCADTLVRKRYIQVKGPVAAFSLTPSTVCTGNTVFFNVHSAVNAHNLVWDFGDGNTSSSTSGNASHIYTYESTQSLSSRNIAVSLIYSNQDSTCEKSDTATVTVHYAKSNIILSDTSICRNEKVLVNDSSFSTSQSSIVYYHWELDSLRSTTVKDPGSIQYKTPGKFTIRHIVASSVGCRDTSYRTLTVHPPPAVLVTVPPLKCKGDTVQLKALAPAGKIYKYKWAPAVDPDSVYNPVVIAGDNTYYTVKISDENSCTASSSVTLTVQKPAVIPSKKDTSVIIGQEAFPNVYAGEGYTYTWTPVDGLSCTDCPNPVVRVLEPRYYKVSVRDTNKCFTREGIVFVDVLPECTFDVPTAFTPNGDGKNDVVYVRGWGIKRLVEFKIYNRWGQVVFYTDKLEEGWNGYYRGELQNVESYVFTVVVENYLGQTHSKTGYLSLLR